MRADYSCLLENDTIVMHLVMAKTHLNIFPSFRNGFSSSQSEKSNDIIAGEQGERERL